MQNISFPQKKNKLFSLEMYLKVPFLKQGVKCQILDHVVESQLVTLLFGIYSVF
jgi:hypothetical protein